MNINELHSRISSQSPRAEKELFEKLTVSFSMFVRQRIREEADVLEIVQDALAVVASKYKGMEFTTSFSAWAYRILEHVLLRYYRSKGNREKLFVRTDELDTAAGSYEPDTSLKTKLLECLKLLSRTRLRHARILTLHFQGFSVDEISSRLGVSSNNFYVMLSRARNQLHECLHQENGN